MRTSTTLVKPEALELFFRQVAGKDTDAVQLTLYLKTFGSLQSMGQIGRTGVKVTTVKGTVVTRTVQNLKDFVIYSASMLDTVLYVTLERFQVKNLMLKSKK